MPVDWPTVRIGDVNEDLGLSTNSEKPLRSIFPFSELNGRRGPEGGDCGGRSSW